MQNTKQLLALDNRSKALRHELELKRRGFRLLSKLSVSLRHGEDYTDMLTRIAQRINISLYMQKTIVLLRSEEELDLFENVVLQGFTAKEFDLLNKSHTNIPPELLEPTPVLVTAENSPEYFGTVRKLYGLAYFIASPIILQGKVYGLIITGRMAEQPPLLGRLGQSDVETIHAITELLSSVLVYREITSFQ